MNTHDLGPHSPEEVSRDVASEHGQELSPGEMEELIRSCGRTPRQRTTAYGDVDPERVSASFEAAELTPQVNEIARAYERESRTPGDLVRPGLDS